MSSNDPQQSGGPAQTPPPSRLSPGTSPAPATGKSTAPSTGSAGGASGPAPTKGSGPAPSAAASPDPLRGSRASGFWATVVFLVVVLVLLAIFVLQNTNSVEISFLGWSGSVPLAAAMMIAAAAGLVLAVAAGTLRILQLRRRVKRDRKVEKKAAAAR